MLVQAKDERGWDQHGRGEGGKGQQDWGYIVNAEPTEITNKLNMYV